jgi:hypothetical protein
MKSCTATHRSFYQVMANQSMSFTWNRAIVQLEMLIDILLWHLRLLQDVIIKFWEFWWHILELVTTNKKFIGIKQLILWGTVDTKMSNGICTMSIEMRNRIWVWISYVMAVIFVGQSSSALLSTSRCHQRKAISLQKLKVSEKVWSVYLV